MMNVSRAYTRNNVRSQKSTNLIITILSLVVILFLITGLTGITETPKPAYAANSTGTVHSGGFTLEMITVRTGDTLWGLASKISNCDTNLVINETIRFNKLKSTYLQEGQIIYVPVKMDRP